MDAKQIVQALDAGKYEATERGILFPQARSILSGTYFYSVNDGPVEQVDNLVVDEGLIYMLNVSLLNGTKAPTWYLSIYAANYTPLPALTAASYPATAAEITSSTEGYTEPNRPAWTPTTPITTPSADNVANKAVFTIATASSLTINGAAMLSEQTKGAVTGTLLSAVKLPAARILNDSDTFNLGYRIQLVSA